MFVPDTPGAYCCDNLKNFIASLPPIDFKRKRPSDLNSSLEFKPFHKTKNGCIYQGEVDKQTGLFEGLGALTKPEGSFYQGWWKQGKKNGYGREVSANYTVYVGNFNQNCKCEYGELSHYDGRLYKGTFLNGLKHGRG